MQGSPTASSSSKNLSHHPMFSTRSDSFLTLCELSEVVVCDPSLDNPSYLGLFQLRVSVRKKCVKTWNTSGKSRHIRTSPHYPRTKLEFGKLDGTAAGEV